MCLYQSMFVRSCNRFCTNTSYNIKMLVLNNVDAIFKLKIVLLRKVDIVTDYKV